MKSSTPIAVAEPTLVGQAVAERRPQQRRVRGQILALFALTLGMFVMMAGILVDSALLMQGQHDIESIAWHSARSAAGQIDWVYYTANCNRAYVVTNGSCDNLLLLNSGAAISTGTAWGDTWLTQSSSQFLRIPAIAPAGSPTNGVSTTVSADRRSVTVSITRCYIPYFFNLFKSNPGPCQGVGQPVSVSVTSSPINGF
jgi:hypothetical protein